jgi:hypothetical protein
VNHHGHECDLYAEEDTGVSSSSSLGVGIAIEDVAMTVTVTTSVLVMVTVALGPQPEEEAGIMTGAADVDSLGLVTELEVERGLIVSNVVDDFVGLAGDWAGTVYVGG